MIKALDFVSTRALACLNLTRSDLTSAIAAIAPRNPNGPVTDHAFKREFLLGPVPEAEARQYLCGQSAAPLPDAEYYGVIFQFRIDGGGVLGLLWACENGKWKIVSYQPLTQ
jgi:hypothetical protein